MKKLSLVLMVVLFLVSLGLAYFVMQNFSSFNLDDPNVFTLFIVSEISLFTLVLQGFSIYGGGLREFKALFYIPIGLMLSAVGPSILGGVEMLQSVLVVNSLLFWVWVGACIISFLVANIVVWKEGKRKS